MTRAAPQSYVEIRRPGTKEYVRAPHVSLSYEDQESKTDKVTIVVSNYDLSAIDGDLWIPGNELRFTFGYANNRAPMRDAIIICLKGFHPTLTVEADSKDELLNRIQRTDRKWEKVKRSDVVREILMGPPYNVPAAQLHVEDTKVIAPTVTQGGRTDMQLIRELAMREGFEFYFAWDGAHFHQRNLKQAPARVLTYFLPDPIQGDIISISIDENKRLRKAGAVKTTARDPETGEVREIRADNASTANDRVKLSDETSTYGSEVLEAVNGVTGETYLTDKPPSEDALKVGTASEVVVASADTPELAAREAAGIYKKSQLQGVKLTIVTPLDPQLFAKSVIELRGVGVRLGGKWYVKEVKHDVNAGTSTAKLAREGSGTANAAKKNDAEPEKGPNGEEIFTDPTGGKWTIQETINPITGESEQTYVPYGGGFQ